MKRSAFAVLLTLASLNFGAAAWAEETVKIGVNGVVSDAAFFIAERKGYFAKQGIKVELVHFDSGPQMVAPLGTGQIDVAAGASSAIKFFSPSAPGKMPPRKKTGPPASAGSVGLVR